MISCFVALTVVKKANRVERDENCLTSCVGCINVSLQDTNHTAVTPTTDFLSHWSLCCLHLFCFFLLFTFSQLKSDIIILE